MTYRVIAVGENCDDLSVMKLEKKVNDLLQQGWKLQGGVSVSKSTSGRIVMTQAMIKG